MTAATAAPSDERLSSDKTEVGSGIVSPGADMEKTQDMDDVVEEKAAQDDDGSAPDDYPHGLKLTLIIAALCLAVFLVALDQTIIAPALGAITAQFQSVKDIVSPVVSCIGVRAG